METAKITISLQGMTLLSVVIAGLGGATHWERMREDNQRFRERIEKRQAKSEMVLQRIEDQQTSLRVDFAKVSRSIEETERLRDKVRALEACARSGKRRCDI